MIKFENVKKQYKDGFVAIKSINLEINKGELVTLIGPSGCGKTTTMRMINRLTEPSAGRILINGEDTAKADPVELRRNIGYVIQQIGLFPHMTIEQNISLVPKLKKADVEKTKKRVDELLDLVGLDPTTFKKRYPSELSGGQQQRIGVIRALAAEPDIILMDEPFSALDPISREQLQDDIVNLQEEIQKTIVFVTHDMDEAIKIANRIVIMKDGEIVQVDTPEQILRRPANDFVKGFIGEERLNQGITLPTASDMMYTEVVTSSPKRGLASALHIMREKRVDNLFITDKDKQFHGVATLEALKENYRNEDLIVSDIMKSNVQTLTADAILTDVAEIFTEGHTSAIPVLDDGKLVGIVTRASMMRGLADMNGNGGHD
ncbi:glycine/betaine ABC transporter ATP-binding protein [Virgibacillus soli]|uniref:ABC transporter ATP-binding protein n=1 Tax=Lederbergia galactosidilytica TaxID=217031 RepID=UPI00071519E6|nr:betaine/proline/choline family ABC transporter ATP-binding protein [Lederbergia galactosidilytica]KRG16530.1 glycine/betaine ABC transporter ATP-binding protein [Virgibacillus soli]MBP1914136.1 osmoprotectant transport system ATP-binding protein [Lederbergia galactosidilytica]